MTPVPGCSGQNNGENFCINPNFEDADFNQPLDSSNGEYAYDHGTLDLCEGNCQYDFNCVNGLVCSNASNHGHVPGCTGTSVGSFNYCTYPELKSMTSTSISNDNVFLRVGDDGIVKVYNEGGTTLIWNSASIDSDTNVVSSETLFDADRNDISALLTKLMYFHGSYSHVNIDFEFEDAEDAGLHVDGNTVEVYATTSLAYRLLSPYPISALSTLSFDVTLGSHIDALAICIDDGVTAKTDGDGRAASTCLALGGFAIEETLGKNVIHLGELLDSDDGVQIGVEPEDLPEETVNEEDPLANYPLQKGKVQVKYLLSKLFPSRTSPVQYIAFVQIVGEVKDVNDDSSPSIIENISLIEETISAESGRRRLLDSIDCEKGKLVATHSPGLHNIKTDPSLDFCEDSSKILQQISKNENDSCSFDTDCRSGLCKNDRCESRVSKNEMQSFTESNFLYHPTIFIFVQ